MDIITLTNLLNECNLKITEYNTLSIEYHIYPGSIANMYPVINLLDLQMVLANNGGDLNNAGTFLMEFIERLNEDCEVMSDLLAFLQC